MKPPPGINLPHPNMVCKPNKSLYKLKQASQQWHAKLTSALISNEFTQSIVDHSMFTKRENGKTLSLLVYVDDVLLVGNDLQVLRQIFQD